MSRELVVSGGKAYTRLERGVLFSCQGVCVAIEFDIFQRPVLLISRIVRRMRMRKIEEEAPAARKFATPYYNPERYDDDDERQRIFTEAQNTETERSALEA